MTTRSMIVLLVAFFGFYLGLAAPAAGKTAACPPDSVLVGRTCVDKYEASVWDLSAVAAKAKIKLIASIKAGTATEATLTAVGAVQLGVGSDDYPCNDNGNDCTDIYAVSIAGVTPSSNLTWFQAQQAATNSGKRLLANAEWQMAAAGTPDPGVSATGSLDCNTKNGGGVGVDAVVDTGSRSNCVSGFGAFDMVGNLWEWVAEWAPLSTGCVPALFADDRNCLAGASTTSGPGALLRGGSFGFGTEAGVFALGGGNAPSSASVGVGFRAGRSALAAAGKTAACPPDSVRVGPICVDKYEASVWDLTLVAAKAKTKLIASIKAGTATWATLTAAGAAQRGVGSDDYPCNDNGNDCTDIYAVSIAGVTPSVYITWFQAQQAAANSGKRLLTNAEWQAAAAGTPDPGNTPGGSDCNTTHSITYGAGSRSNCVSRFGAFDMVGNLYEWVADWVPQSTVCVTALFASDFNCLAGASTSDGPGALIRGGRFTNGFGGGVSAGVFAVYGFSPSTAGDSHGFRPGR